jgi:hypothetical protein
MRNGRPSFAALIYARNEPADRGKMNTIQHGGNFIE